MSKTKTKPTPMAKILEMLEKEAASNKFIEDYDGEKVFNYYRFTEHCHNIASDTNQQYGFQLRDIAMEAVDKKFNRNQPFKFRGFDCID